MFLFGRDYARGLTFERPDDVVARVRDAELGF
jgi:hypothetical protein